MLRRILIRLKLVLARVHRQQRLQQKRKIRYHQKKQNQRHRGRGCGDIQALIKPGLLHQIAEQPQEKETGGKGPRDALDDMAAFEMAEFMRQHCFDFGRT